MFNSGGRSWPVVFLGPSQSQYVTHSKEAREGLKKTWTWKKKTGPNTPPLGKGQWLGTGLWSSTSDPCLMAGCGAQFKCYYPGGSEDPKECVTYDLPPCSV